MSSAVKTSSPLRVGFSTPYKKVFRRSSWRASRESGRRRSGGKRGYLVLCSRPAEAETKLSYTGVADLFAEVEEQALVQLPSPQQRALRVALLRADPDGSVDQRAVAAAVTSIVLAAGRERPI